MGPQGIPQDYLQGKKRVLEAHHQWHQQQQVTLQSHCWHKLASNLKSPPLKVNGTTIEDMMEKAEVLWTEILERFSADDDLDHNPLQNWDGTGHLNWCQSASLEEVE